MKHAALTLALAFTAGTALHAQVYQYAVGDTDHDSVLDSGSLGYNANAGYVDNLKTSYNANTESFDFAVDFSAKDGSLANGFWLVVSDGPNPKNHVDEYSIFYFDGTRLATGGDAIVTSYVYSGQNSSLSWQNPAETLFSTHNGDPISASGSIVGDVASFEFSVDASGMNDPSQWPASHGLGADWDGAQFGDEIGMWFHPFVAAEDGIHYWGRNHELGGFICKLDVEKQGWVDVGGQETVPEPSALLLGALGGIGLLTVRRRK